ncbi:MAG: ANTAR domain-containing protein [Acidimicrobiales bacterium]
MQATQSSAPPLPAAASAEHGDDLAAATATLLLLSTPDGRGRQPRGVVAAVPDGCLDEALESLVRLAPHCVRGCVAASVTVATHDVTASASTDPHLAVPHLPADVARRGPERLRAGEVVCLDASALGHPGPPSGVSNVLLAPVVHEGDLLGTITLYAGSSAVGQAVDQAGGPSPPLRLLAQQVAAAVAASREVGRLKDRVAGLQTALDNRDVIGQAKGILMASGGVDPGRAFGMLVAASQRQNRKLRDIAAELVERTANRRAQKG